MEVKLIVELISGIFASIGACFASYATYKIFTLEKIIEKENQALVHVWFNAKDFELGPGNEASHFSIINIGNRSLHIRKIRILDNAKNKMYDFALCTSYKKEDTPYSKETVDVLFAKDVLYKLVLKDVPNQFILEIMYYDASFEFVKIDQSRSGGTYTIKGISHKL